MKNKIIIAVIATAFAIGAYVAYRLYKSSQLSPRDTASFSYQGLDLKVDYGRPSKRGRVIFGEASSNALQPNGKYWRLGANAPTEVTFSKNIAFAGKPVNAATYRLYCVPSASSWQLYLNSEIDSFSGASEPDHTLDILTVEIPLEMSESAVEQFTIEFSSNSKGASMNLMWDRALVKVPIAIQ